MNQALFIARFKEPGTEGLMHFQGTTDNPIGKLIEFPFVFFVPSWWIENLHGNRSFTSVIGLSSAPSPRGWATPMPAWA